MTDDAVSMIAQAAAEPSLDELGRRARQIRAMEEPSESDLRDLVLFYRRERASWGSKQEREEDE